MANLNSERIIDAIFSIWHELPELLNERWDSFKVGLFECLRAKLPDATNDEIAQASVDYFRKYQEALARLDSKYQELSFKTESSECEIIPVYFATSRYYDSSQQLDQQFTGLRGDGALSYGVAEVTIPPDHRMGKLEYPPFWRSESLAKDLTIYSLTKLSQPEFSVRANGVFKEGQQRAGMVFVHGYKVTFRAALLRIGQLAYDLNFKGLPLLFSWPSTGRFLDYSADEDTVDWSRQHRHFESFLEFCLNELHLDTIHLIAHSMGNRILTETLAYLANVQTKNKIGQVIFAAPDIGGDVFKGRAAYFPPNATRYTLYASKHDLAVGFSSFLHGGYSRAGKIESDNNVVIVPPVETIDASSCRSDFFEHSYFGDNKSVVSDIFQLLRHNHNPDDRPGLRARVLQNGKVWFFQ